MKRNVAQTLAFLIAAAVAIGVGVWAGDQWFRPQGSGGEGRGTGAASIGGKFELVDQNGRTRTDSEFRGKLMLIYFGYAFCPDACPTALQAMTLALNRLGPAADGVVPMFITVDPERDTPEQLKRYAENFHPRLVALTGSADQVAQAATAYRVYYAKQKDPNVTGGYLMDHTSIIYLMGRDGRYLSHFTHATSPEAMAAEIEKTLAKASGPQS
jgi:protein SCO1/2